jgi:hypothetical protein
MRWVAVSQDYEEGSFFSAMCRFLDPSGIGSRRTLLSLMTPRRASPEITWSMHSRLIPWEEASRAGRSAVGGKVVQVPARGYNSTHCRRAFVHGIVACIIRTR